MRKRQSRTRVRRSRIAGARAAPQRNEWTAVAHGLLVAGNLQALFPDFYTAHVAHRPTTLGSLLGVVQAFFSLAGQHVELLLPDELETNPDDPLAVLEPNDVDDAWACAILSEDVGRDVHELWPVVYGLDDVEEATLGVTPQLVAAVCWCLAAETEWALPFDGAHSLIPALQRQLYQCRISPAILARVDDLPRLPAAVPMEALCDALDVQPPLEGCKLGPLMRYCFHATGNEFADLTSSVVAQMASSDLDWRSADLREIGRQQRAAQQFAQDYDRLNLAALRSAAVLDEVISRVMSTALDLVAANAEPQATEPPPSSLNC
jgi:hypothetical protein